MRNILLFLGSLAAVLVVSVGLYQWLGQPKSGPATVQTTMPKSAPVISTTDAAKVRADDYVIGSATAPLTIIEYASLTCSHCQNFHAKILPVLKKDYIDTGKLRLVYRDFPLDGIALRGSMLARCVGKERSLALIDIIFKRQGAMVAAKDPVAALAKIAGLGGMSKDAVKKCLEDKALQAKILAGRVEAEKVFGIDGTPGFVINGKKVMIDLDPKAFKAVIDPLLAKAGK
ncbi:MAG: DsbA family protein [Rhodospirillales bacterium]|jgi:protein-disulfide isomerase|nr:DsbA family protein [Rhodospirillales bacterium]MBT4006646.1 DsbA family protein [Rhodospirillales bacterium]MBT5076225.1 DsbA family protein [Rhodospirillales bacterium]MBT5113924.1 DsbA family protein [Rhodospirillales bacterium]MBT5672452.1 DsbA family protein [Rhodospirillales bacterium]